MIKYFLIILGLISCGPGLKINEKLAGTNPAERVFDLAIKDGYLQVRGSGVENTNQAYLRSAISSDGKVLGDVAQTELTIHEKKQGEIILGPKVTLGLSPELIYSLLLKSAQADSVTPFKIIIDSSEIDLYIEDGSISGPKLKDGSITIKKLDDMGASDGDVLKYDSSLYSGAGGWYPAPEAGGGGGGVTSVTTSTGLIGGTITTSGVIAVDVGTSAGKIPQLDTSGDLNIVKNINVAETGKIVLQNSGGPQNFSILNDGSLKLYDETNGAPRFSIDNVGDVTIGGGLTVGGQGVCLADGTDCPPSGAGGTVTSVDASGGLTGGPIVNSGTISIANGGVTAAKLNQMGASGGQILKWNGATWEASTDNDSGGTLTQIIAGTGLDGGTITTSGTISISTGGITTTQILNGTIQSVDITDGAITEAKLNQMSASSGQVMKWDGGAWVASDDVEGITSITAGTGLDGGTITTSGTISLSTGGVTSTHIANGTIYNVDIASDASIDVTKLGFGDLTIDHATNSPKLIFRADNNNTVTFTTPTALSNTYALTFPHALGSNGQFLRTDASGNLTWADATVDSTGINDEAVTLAKMATFTDGYLIVGKGAGIDPVYVNVTGDATFFSTGVLTINSGAITASKLNQMGASTGETLKWDGATWEASTDREGVTSITAGTGLDGGTITSSGTVSLSTGGVTSAHIANGTIYNVDIANDASIDMTKLGFGNLTIDSSTASPNLIFRADNNNTVTFTTPAALPNTYTLTLPTALGSFGQFLKTNAVGDLYFDDASIDSADLANGSITLSKLADLTSANFIIGDGTNRPTAATMSGDGSLSNTGVFAIGSGVIINADVSSSANIDASKLGTGIISNTEFNYLDGLTGAIQTQINNVSADANGQVTLSKMADLTSANFIIGDGTNRPTAATMSGDGSLSNTGVFAIGSGVIINADVSSSANIDATKLGTGIISNTEFNYLDGVTSAIQTQINNVSADANGQVPLSKMADLASANFIIGDGTNRPTAATMSGDGSLSNTGVFAIGLGVIVNADVSSSANIDATKLGTGIISNTEFNYLDGVTSAIQTQINNVSADANGQVPLSKMADLTSANFIIGDGTNRPTAATMSGDGSLSNTGVFAIGSGVIINADVSASAAIDASKLGTGIVSNTEFNYLDGVTSAIQTQLDDMSTDTVNKAPTYYFTRTLPTTIDDYVEIGSFAATDGAHNLLISITVNDPSFSLTKSYDFLAVWNHTGGTWTKVLPTHDTSPFGTNDIDLDVNVNNPTMTLRIRRTSGSTAGTARVRIINLGSTTTTATALSGTGSTTAPTYNISSSGFYKTISAGRPFVGVGGITPTAYLDVGGAIGAGETSLTLRSGNGHTYPSPSAQIRLGYNNTNSYAHMIRTRHSNGNAYDNAIEFYLWNTSQTSSDEGNTHMMSITGGGVGINGQYAPSYALDVSGDAFVSKAIYTKSTVDASGAISAGGNQGGTNSLLLKSGDAQGFPADSTQIQFGFDNQALYRHSIRTRHNTSSIRNAIDFYVWRQGQADTDLGDKMVLNIGYSGIGVNGAYDSTYALDVSGDMNVTGTASSIAIEAPINVTFENGWTNYGAGYATGQYYKDAMGIVHLQGLLKSGTCGSTMFTLPAGYRPAYAKHMWQMTGTATPSATLIYVTTTGAVYAYSGICSNAWVSIEGLTFRAGY